MISTRSQKLDTTVRLWLMNISPIPRSRTRSSRMRNTSFCTVTSSADVGSSAISRSGSATSIMAIIARCPMPPDN